MLLSFTSTSLLQIATIIKFNTGLIIMAGLDENRIDFLNGSFFNQNELADCYLSEQELQSFLAPPQETWRDYLPHENEALITMDSSKDIQWKLAKDEINHVRRQVQHLLSIDEYKNVNMEEIIMFTLGPDSKAGLYLQAELELDKKHTYNSWAHYASKQHIISHPLNCFKTRHFLKIIYL